MERLNNKVATATKWSVLTELAAKLVSPISNVILARILTPDAFGVVVTITMVTSFVSIFSDAGFQRYIIHKEFKDEEDKNQTVNVAFWTNLFLSIVFWLILFVFRENIASIVGNPGLGNVIAIASFSIPLISLSSIQIAVFQRNFDFKSLFYVKIIGVFVPLVVTIPLAFLLKSYWAIIIGSLSVYLSNVTVLYLSSKWKPKLEFSFNRLKSMITYSSWVVFDSILIWLTSYIDIFFIGRMFDQYYLGLYKTSITLVGQIIALITSMVMPVMLPTLSRLQSKPDEFKAMLLKFQKNVGIFLIPLGALIYLYREQVTYIMLGNQWLEASEFIGIWGFISTITVIFSRFSSVVFPSIGKPKYSVYSQILHLIFLIPVIIYFGNIGFRELYITRSLIRFELIFVNLVFVYILIKLSPLDMVKNILPQIFATLCMSIVSFFLLTVFKSITLIILSFSFSIIVYLAIISMFANERKILKSTLTSILSRLRRK